MMAVEVPWRMSPSNNVRDWVKVQSKSRYQQRPSGALTTLLPHCCHPVQKLPSPAQVLGSTSQYWVLRKMRDPTISSRKASLPALSLLCADMIDAAHGCCGDQQSLAHRQNKVWPELGRGFISSTGASGSPSYSVCRPVTQASAPKTPPLGSFTAWAHISSL